MSGSIRNRTLALVLALLALAMTSISWKGYRDAHHEIEELFDAQLAQSARLLQGLVGPEMQPEQRQQMQQSLDGAVNAGGRYDHRTPGHHYEHKLGFEVFDGNGRMLLRSASVPDEVRLLLLKQLDAITPNQAQDLPGYHNVQLDDHLWRLFVLHDDADKLWVMAAERSDVRGELVGKIALRSLLPDLIGLPLLALLLWFAVGWGLAPLSRMARALKAREPDNLAPLVLAPLPRELEPMEASLNRLLGQVNLLLQREKRFIADAAHELRTPLAVLRVHAQNALSTQDAAERDAALTQLVRGVDRSTRLVAQMLALARLEPDASREPIRQRIDLAQQIRESLAELAPLALARDQELDFSVDEELDCHLLGDPGSLDILLQNLVGNALQYGHEGGRVHLSLSAQDHALLLCVDDDGPGIAAEQRERVMQRFFRLGQGQGAGLGLAIVARVVELHQARLSLEDSPLGGLRVRILLPRATQDRTE